jgi:hypothetical protein
MTLLRLFGTCAPLGCRLRRLDFGDDGFDCGFAWRLHCPQPLPRLLRPRFELSPGRTFPWSCPRYLPLRRSCPRRLGGLAGRTARYRLSFPYRSSLLPFSHNPDLLVSVRGRESHLSMTDPGRKPSKGQLFYASESPLSCVERQQGFARRPKCQRAPAREFSPCSPSGGPSRVFHRPSEAARQPIES